jgi:hypothetical protein
MTARYDRCSVRSRSAFVLMTLAWIECATSGAMAELGPCTTAVSDDTGSRHVRIGPQPINAMVP